MRPSIDDLVCHVWGRIDILPPTETRDLRLGFLIDSQKREEILDMTLPRALAGVRVLDFTWVRAGPWATRWLGAFGAEVIKIEWPEHLDILRGNRNTVPPEMELNPNTPGQFADTNVNKLGLTINVRTARGLELIKRLIAVSDVVIENFSSRVMRNWGIGYDVMQQLKPDIIYVSMAGFGHTGRHHHYTTMGPSAQALSGQTFLSGLPGKPPAGWGWSYLDDTGGMYGAMCVLTALHHRNVTGQGQHVDLSQMTAGITLTGPAFLDRTVNGRQARRDGYPPGNRTVWPGKPVTPNYRGPTVAPHNAYRTKGGGHNDWCVIACFSDAEWHDLVGLMGNPTWATDVRFSTLSGRLAHQEEMDEGIERWTQTLEKYELTAKCQGAGVHAMPVQSSENRVEHDPQLRARGMYGDIEHPLLGRRKVQGVPFKLSRSPAAVHRPAPLIGQHTRQVLQELLGLSLEEIRSGYADGTFWPKDKPMYPYIEEALR
jgi:benzylsuccinate CoA-transferase BbsF subunit